MIKAALIGESWGEAEERERVPFVGAAGYQLTQMLDEAGLRRADLYLTNVFNRHPPGNKVEWFCGPKSSAIKGYPALIKGKYVRQEFIPELERLGDELLDLAPNLVIACGNTPLWALCGHTGIGKLRGTTLLSTHIVEGLKVLPTYHPSAVLRQWELRPIVVIDLAKAKREAEFPEIRRPLREIWIEPTLKDIEDFHDRYIRGCTLLTVDIETAGNQVTSIGFASGSGCAIVIPFFDARRKDRSYWHTYDDERKAWLHIKDILELPYRKLFQNGLYDIAFLWRSYGIKCYNADEDTMLLHHALQPESLKSLGFLGSVYCDEGAWKEYRKGTTTIKRDA